MLSQEGQQLIYEKIFSHTTAANTIESVRPTGSKVKSTYLSDDVKRKHIYSVNTHTINIFHRDTP